ncbi:unnamed protein product [Camellia sinensis]
MNSMGWIAPLPPHLSSILRFPADSPVAIPIRHSNDMENWLLHPMRESNLQLFALVSIWTSSKMHDSHPLSVKCLKSLGDEMIKEQHFTTRDFLEAVRGGPNASKSHRTIVDGCICQLQLTCFATLSLLLERVASFVITVPKQRWEFPVLPWDAYKMIGSNHESGPRSGFTRPDHVKCCGLERSSSLPSCCTVSPLHC